MSGITVDLPEGEELVGRVVEEAARQMLRNLSYDEDENPHSVPSELHRKLSREIDSIIREQAVAAAPIVAAEILEKGVQPTDTWGEPRGDCIPLKTVIAEMVYNNLRDGQTGRSGRGILQLMIEREVGKQVRAELQEALDEAKAKITAAVKEEAATALADVLVEALPRAEL